MRRGRKQLVATSDVYQQVKTAIFGLTRTPLSLDHDVAEALERLLERGGTSMNALINNALRLGLAELVRLQAEPGFRTQSVSLRPRVSNVDDIAELLST